MMLTDGQIEKLDELHENLETLADLVDTVRNAEKITHVDYLEFDRLLSECRKLRDEIGEVEW